MEYFYLYTINYLTVKKFLKKILYLFRFIGPIRHYVFEWELAGKAGGLLLVNFIFQRIFRINSGIKFSVNFTSKIAYPSRIKLHKDKITVGSFVLSGNCYLQGYNGIEIGKNFLFAPGIKLISSNHDSNNVEKSINNKPIIIGNNVWIGANAVILPGVKLGNHCVVGAGSVVTKSFEEDNLIIAGNPAKIIKYIQV